jgi:DNA polymerase-4
VKELRRILHVDLDPFLVSVERSLDPSLAGRAVVVGGDPEAGTGHVAAASDEARAAGVRPGQALSAARRLCPSAVFRPGDLEAYARVGQEVGAVLLAASRRVERPSSDEAYVDLTDGPESPVVAAERVKDEIQRRLGLPASLGLASSRLAARIASRCARPRGFLIVLPGYEASFLAAQPVGALEDLPPHLEEALLKGGLGTIGALAQADPAELARLVGPGPAGLLARAARGEGDDLIPTATPPSTLLEEATIRDRRTDGPALEAILDALASRASRKLRPFDLSAGSLTVEVRSREGARRRSEVVEPGISEDAAIAKVARRLAGPLFETAAGVRALSLRLSRLSPPTAQAPLFTRNGSPASRRV